MLGGVTPGKGGTGPRLRSSQSWSALCARRGHVSVIFVPPPGAADRHHGGRTPDSRLVCIRKAYPPLTWCGPRPSSMVGPPPSVPTSPYHRARREVQGRDHARRHPQGRRGGLWSAAADPAYRRWPRSRPGIGRSPASIGGYPIIGKTHRSAALFPDDPATRAIRINREMAGAPRRRRRSGPRPCRSHRGSSRARPPRPAAHGPAGAIIAGAWHGEEKMKPCRPGSHVGRSRPTSACRGEACPRREVADRATLCIVKPDAVAAGRGPDPGPAGGPAPARGPAQAAPEPGGGEASTRHRAAVFNALCLHGLGPLLALVLEAETPSRSCARSWATDPAKPAGDLAMTSPRPSRPTPPRPYYERERAAR